MIFLVVEIHIFPSLRNTNLEKNWEIVFDKSLWCKFSNYHLKLHKVSFLETLG